MKYKKCPRCELNYIQIDCQLCSVCQDELNGKKSIFDLYDDTLLCPYCRKNQMGIDEIMCQQCANNRKKEN